jgi:ADP-heptose:LPS heptosyltransferase
VNIVVTKISPVGDAVSFLPTLSGLSEHVPEANLTVVCTPAGREVFDGAVPGLDFLVIDYHEVRGVSSVRFLAPTLLVFKAKKFAISCHSYDEPSFSYLLTRAMGIRRRIGFGSSIARGQLLISERIPFDNRRNVVDLNLDLVRQATGNWNLHPQRVTISYSKLDRMCVEENLAKIGIIQGLPFVVIHPGAGQRHREWGMQNYLSVAKTLEDSLGLTVLFVSEFDKLSSCRSLSGLSIKQLACLLEMAVVFIGNNSGPMHIAAAMGTPCVVVQGATAMNQEIFWNHIPHHTIKAAHLPCVPCERLWSIPDRCLNQEYPQACMKELSPQRVTEQVLEFLTRIDCRHRK